VVKQTDGRGDDVAAAAGVGVWKTVLVAA